MENKKKSDESVNVKKNINLFEDTGNFHNEEELKKSYDRVPDEDKNSDKDQELD